MDCSEAVLLTISLVLHHEGGQKSHCSQLGGVVLGKRNEYGRGGRL